MSKAKLPTFSLMVKATIDYNVDIRAATLEEALAKALAMRHYDLLPKGEPSGGYNDYDVNIVGIWK